MKRAIKFSSLGFLLIAVAYFFIPQSRAAAEIDCKTLPELFRAYLASHVTKRKLTDEIKAATAEQYLSLLDPSKTLFLESDIAPIKKDLLALFDSMSKGYCQNLDKLQQLVISRTVETQVFAEKFLGKDYVLKKDVQIVIDPKKRTYPKTQAEKDEITTRFIHFQIANYLVTDMKLEEAKKRLIHRYELATKRVKERASTDTLNQFADAFSNALDPHSSYMSMDILDEFRIGMGLSLEGIGASLSSQDGYTTVEEIIPGGAADKSKLLKQKDKIIAVTQDKGEPVNVIDKDVKEVVKLIRGKAGTKVKLTLLRSQGERNERLDVTIVRAKIDLKEQAAKLNIETITRGKKSYKVAIVDLPSFYGDNEKKRSSFEDMKKLLAEAQKKKVSGMVLNLSRNGGGLLPDAYRISGLFLKKGAIVATKDARGSVEILADEDESIVYSGPLVILTSRASASASEILAGALKDYGRAVIAGSDHTFGKGTVQAVIPLPGDLGAMKVTTGMFFLPGGSSTQHQGVSGDIIIPSVLNQEDIGEKALTHSLPPQKIASFLGKQANLEEGPTKWTPIQKSWIPVLQNRSRERVAKNKNFNDIRKDIEDAKKNAGTMSVADILDDQNQKEKKKSDEKKSLAERVKDADAPYLEEAVQIVADLVELQES